MKHKVINLFAGAGTGKSTTCAALFAYFKYKGANTEMITEYAKDAAWEGRLHSESKIARSQEYIFGKQSFKLARVASEVDFCITDSPLLLTLVYGENYPHKSLLTLAKEVHDSYDNINIFLRRNKPYNPKGRIQTEDQAIELDVKIKQMLCRNQISFYDLEFGKDNIESIEKIMKANWGLSYGE